MRIGTFLREWTPGGGVQRHTLEIIDRLPDVEWVCFGHRFETEVPDPVSVPDPPGSAGLQQVWRFLASPRRMAKAREEHDLDLVHAQDANLLGHDVVTVHGCFPAYAERYLSERYRRLHPTYHRQRWIQKLSLERTEGPIIAVSQTLRDQMLDHYAIDPDRVRVVYNGVDLDRFHPEASGEDVRARHGFDADDEVLVFVGHEYERKGFADILHALPDLPDHVHVMSVGGGDRRPWEQKARDLGVDERVTFTGYVPDDELPAHYAAADAFVFPTRYEAHSLVILEALASGLPVVLGDVPATREVVTDGREGHLVTPDEPGKLAEAVSSALDQRDAMGKAARSRAEDFPWDRTARETRAVYEDVLG